MNSLTLTGINDLLIVRSSFIADKTLCPFTVAERRAVHLYSLTHYTFSLIIVLNNGIHMIAFTVITIWWLATSSGSSLTQ